MTRPLVVSPVWGGADPVTVAESKSALRGPLLVGTVRRARAEILPPIVQAIVEPLLVLVTLAGLAGTAIGFVADHGWIFDLVGSLRWQLILSLLFSSIGLVLVHRIPLALMAVAGIAVSLVVVIPPFLGSDELPTVVGDSLDLTFHNTKYQVDLDAVADVVRQRDDDLVVLSNTDWVSHRDLDRADIGGLTIISGPQFTEDLEITVLARDPDLEVIVHRLAPQARDWVVEVVAELDGEPVHVLGAHPVSPRDPERAARRDALLDWVAASASNRDAETVVLGDLNTPPWSPSFRNLVAGGGLTDSQRGRGMQPSWPARAGVLGLPIDHALVSAGLVTLERELGPALGSDHRMLHARVARQIGG